MGFFRLIPNSVNSLQFRKLSLALSMQTKQLTYVGPDSMGPHYIESGKRPDPGIENPAKIILQLQDGSITFGGYSSPGNFAGIPYGEEFWVMPVTDNAEIVTPVCWWHLPAAAPMTEREWFDKAGLKKGYQTDLWEIDTHFEFRGQLISGGWDGPLRATIDEAITDAYHHWVAAGRP